MVAWNNIDKFQKQPWAEDRTQSMISLIKSSEAGRSDLYGFVIGYEVVELWSKAQSDCFKSHGMITFKRKWGICVWAVKVTWGFGNVAFFELVCWNVHFIIIW